MDFIDGLVRSVEPIDQIINGVLSLFSWMFATSGQGANQGSWASMVINTIINNDYLLISLSLITCGFAIGILKRLINS